MGIFLGIFFKGVSHHSQDYFTYTELVTSGIGVKTKVPTKNQRSLTRKLMNFITLLQRDLYLGDAI